MKSVGAVSELAWAWHAGRHAAARLLLFAALPLLAAYPQSIAAQPVKGEVSATIDNGFARLVFILAEDVESSVKAANGVIVITFQRPVSISIDKLATSAPGYVSAARRDPDGKGIRIALARKATVNSMAAAERLYVDLLPETWSGLPPGLPREVIEDLARRAREADKKLRQQRVLMRQNKMTAIRVRVAVQPTFTRYVFELPELIGVAASNSRDKLTLSFDALLKFDLADARATLPDVIQAIDSEIEQDSVVVRFTFADRVDVRTFREDLAFVVDVTPMQGRSQRQEATVRPEQLSAMAAERASRPGAPPAAAEPPPTVPARRSTPAASAERSAPAPVPQSPAETPKSEEPFRQSAAETPKPASVPRSPAAAPKSEPLPQSAAETPKPGSVPQSAVEAPKPAPQPAVATPEAASAAPAPASEPAPPSTEPAAPPSAAARGPAAAAEPTDPREPGAAQAVAHETPPAPPAPVADHVEPGSPVVHVGLVRQGERASLLFPFASTTPAAVFSRADTVWLIFDTEAKLDLAKLANDHVFKGVRVTRRGDVAVVRIKLDRPRLVSAAADGPAWTVSIGGETVEPTRPVQLSRNVVGAARASVIIAFDDARRLHRLVDPDAGDTLLVATALAPARGLMRTQDFVEFRALASIHGVVVQPVADDLATDIAADRIVVSRPEGLILSPAADGASDSAAYQPHVLGTQSWNADRQADFRERSMQLLRAAAEAPEEKRAIARAQLARFYLARDMAVEAKAVLDVAVRDNPPTSEDPTPLVLRAVAKIMLGRIEPALEDLGNPLVGNQHDAPLWRALVHSLQGKWSDAREGFRASMATVATLPLDVQRMMLKEMVRTSIEVGDVTDAVKQMHDFEAIGIPRELEPTLSVLSGRIAERLGRIEDALRAYQAAAASWDRPAAAQGRLRELVLQRTLGRIARPQAIQELETIATVWRGDETEVEALQLLARLYTEERRYRDAFNVMRTALAAHPNSEMTRRIHDEAAATFDSLFLAGKGDALPAVEALSLFYDFRDLTPIGRRGDEMIRRLSERLVAVDLLDQAAELLKHQVDHRLQGAARAQVATRLAVIYLMNRKPDRALAVLRGSRVAELSSELRNQRLLLEARALSDLGRHDVALEVVEDIPGREANRLRADILWAGRRWREAAEQIELMYGERWREFEPLSDVERRDVLRAAIGYVLGEDSLGLERFRERYAGKMGDGADRRAFDVVTAPVSAGEGNEATFREVARAVAAIDTLDAFLADLRNRFPDAASAPQEAQAAAPGSGNL